MIFDYGKRRYKKLKETPQVKMVAGHVKEATVRAKKTLKIKKKSKVSGFFKNAGKISLVEE